MRLKFVPPARFDDDLPTNRVRGAAAVGVLLLLFGLAGLCLWSFGCASAPSRPTPTPPGPPQFFLLVQVVAKNGAPVKATLLITDNDNKGRGGETNADGVLKIERLIPNGFTICAKAEGFSPNCAGVTLIASQNLTIVLTPVPPSIPHGRIAGRIRTTPDGLANDAGPLRLFGISEFDLVWLALNGHQADVIARLDKDVAGAPQLNAVRVFAMASVMFPLTPDMPGYDAAFKWVLEQANARGLYVLVTIFADCRGPGSHGDLYPNASDRERVLRHLVGTFDRPGVVWAVANEARQNGWQEADDPALLRLCDILAGLVGHRDLIASDPADGENVDGSAETLAREITIGKHVNLIVLHDSRTGGSAPSGDRWRRWIAHVEGFGQTTIPAVRKAVGRPVYGIHEEPMGAASVCSGSRECDPGANVAGGMTGVATDTAWLYHRIASQDPGTPGLPELSAVLAAVPVRGTYLNDCIGDSPSCGFSGWDKVRWWITGNSAVGIAYGATPGAIKYRGGWHETGTLYSGPHARVIQVAR